jgi:hypothetical protein
VLLTRSNEQGAYWARHEISLNISQSFQIIIEATVGDSYQGDIAIDDLSFSPDCQYAQESLPNPLVTIPTPNTKPVVTTFDIYEKNYISQQIYSPHCCSSDPSAQSLAKLHTRNIGTHF